MVTPDVTPVVKATVSDIALIDELGAKITTLHLELVRELTELAAAHAELDQRHARTINPRLQELDGLFRQLQALATPLQSVLVKRRTKTAARHGFTMRWHSMFRIGELTDEQVAAVIAYAKTQPVSVRRKIIRWQAGYTLRLNTLRESASRELVKRIPGLTCTEGEDFRLELPTGWTLTSANPLWPNLEALRGDEKLKRLLTPGDD